LKPWALTAEPIKEPASHDVFFAFNEVILTTLQFYQFIVPDDTLLKPQCAAQLNTARLTNSDIDLSKEKKLMWLVKIEAVAMSAVMITRKDLNVRVNIINV